MSEELKENFNQTLMCYEAYIYSELGESYPVTNQHKWDREKAKSKLLELFESYAKEREIEARVDELKKYRSANFIVQPAHSEYLKGRTERLESQKKA